MALPAGGLGGEGAAGGTGDPAAVQPPDPLLSLLPASGAGGAVFTVRGPERTGRMGSSWRGERGCCGGVTHLPTQGCHEHGVRSRCLGMARAGGGDSGGAGGWLAGISPLLAPPRALAGGLISGDSSAGETVRAAPPPRPRPVPAAAMCEMR